MTKTNHQDDCVQVDNLSLAAALISSGCKLTATTQIAPGRFQFTVTGQDAEVMVAEYTLGRLEGNLKNFMTAFDLLRTKVRTGGR